MVTNYSSEQRCEISLLLNEAFTAQENERRATLSVLQEDIGQTLTALAVHLRLAEKICESSECGMHLTEARGLVSSALQYIDRLAHDIVPPALQSQGLGPAVEVLARDYTHETQIRTEIDFEILPVRPKPEIEMALFRVIQESMQNIYQHRCAEFVRIIYRQINENLLVVIEDNGGDYAPELLSHWDFLRVMHRVEALAGVVSVERISGLTTRLVVKLPLQIEAAPHD